LGEVANDEKLFIAFAQFEERAREYDRARAIYKCALEHLPNEKVQELYKHFVSFEKQYGSPTDVERVIISQRRFQYEEEVKQNSKNYDVWAEYIRLEEGSSDVPRIREVYERAISNVPPIAEKSFWQRYVYLWVNYAVFEELKAQDISRARQVYKRCIQLLPHKEFSFSKVWILFARFEVRQLDLIAARAILDQAIELSGKEKIFEAYIELELKLRDMSRCRKLYGTYLERYPFNAKAWIKFAELEMQVREVERARHIFELAVGQPMLDMPEVLWKAYIEFEMGQGQTENTIALYSRLLDRTKHFKVWISFAQYMYSIGRVEEARKVYENAHNCLKAQDKNKEERVLLLQSWKQFEEQVMDQKGLARVNSLLPKCIKRKRQIQTEDGSNTGSWEEYYDYIFPDEQPVSLNLKILQRAHQWKTQASLAHDAPEMQQIAD